MSRRRNGEYLKLRRHAIGDAIDRAGLSVYAEHLLRRLVEEVNYTTRSLEGVTKTDLAQFARLTRRKADQALAELVAAGMVKVDGFGPNRNGHLEVVIYDEVVVVNGTGRNRAAFAQNRASFARDSRTSARMTCDDADRKTEEEGGEGGEDPRDPLAIASRIVRWATDELHRVLAEPDFANAGNDRLVAALRSIEDEGLTINYPSELRKKLRAELERQRIAAARAAHNCPTCHGRGVLLPDDENDATPCPDCTDLRRTA